MLVLLVLVSVAVFNSNTVNTDIQDTMGVSDVSAIVCCCFTVTTFRQKTMGVSAVSASVYCCVTVTKMQTGRNVS